MRVKFLVTLRTKQGSWVFDVVSIFFFQIFSLHRSFLSNIARSGLTTCPTLQSIQLRNELILLSIQIILTPRTQNGFWLLSTVCHWSLILKGIKTLTGKLRVFFACYLILLIILAVEVSVPSKVAIAVSRTFTIDRMLLRVQMGIPRNIKWSWIKVTKCGFVLLQICQVVFLLIFDINWIVNFFE